MGRREPVESAQILWRNRRVQRSAGFALIVLVFIVLCFYSRRSWPENAYTNPQTPSGLQKTRIPSKSYPSNGVAEEPLYDSHVPQYDPHNMPPIPSTVESDRKPITSSLPALDPKRVALLIETRPLSSLPAVLSQFISVIPEAWIVRFVGSADSFSIVKQSYSLSRQIRLGKLVMTEIPDNYPVNTIEALSATLTNLTFYSEFLAPAEWLLLFQSDSIICSASNQSVDDWVAKGYSWVGAPWPGPISGGNGGLSLRNVPSIIKVLKNETRKAKDEVEDIWLISRLPNIAPKNVSKTFSVESIYYEHPLGYHLRGSGKLVDADIWRNATRKRQIFEYCPEIKIVMGNMNLESADEGEAEKNEKNSSASALAALFKGAATKTLVQNGTQTPEAEALIGTSVAATEDAAAETAPMETTVTETGATEAGETTPLGPVETDLGVDAGM